MRSEEKNRIIAALVKRAVGYRTVESVDEYSAGEGGEAVFVRRKVTDKDVPADVAAARLLLEVGSGEEGVAALSDAELYELHERLMKEIGEMPKKNSGGKNGTGRR